MVKKKKSIFDDREKLNVKTIKTTLKSILKDYNKNSLLIFNLVNDCNQIVIILYQFIKLYYLYLYDNDFIIPEFSKKEFEEFINYCLRAIGNKAKSNGKIKNLELQNELNEFYINEFQPIFNHQKFDLKNKKYALNYLKTQIATAFYNNIKEHFITRFRRFINLTFPYPVYKFKTKINKKGKEYIIKEKNKKNAKLAFYIKNIILLDKNEIIEEIQDETLYNYIRYIQNEILPLHYEKSYSYDIKANPSKYFYYTIKMNDILEKLNNKSRSCSDPAFVDNIKLYHALPLRTQIIPKYITLDSSIILNILNIPETNYKKNHPIGKKKGQKKVSELENEIFNNNRKDIWEKLFKMNSKVLKLKGYEFKTIQTDGIGASICYQKIGYKENKKEKILEDNDIYISDLSNEEIKLCLTMKKVADDPGCKDLAYLYDGDKILKYSRFQRNVESYNKRYKRINENNKKKEKIQEIEKKLNDVNAKTVNYKKFKEYIKIKNEVNEELYKFYNNIRQRKFRLRKFIYKRKSEDKLINKIKDIYGKDPLLCCGNWSNNRNLKHIVPTMNKGLKKIFSKHFKVVLVDEYKTSILCNKCKNELTNIKKKNKKIHRLLTCEECNKCNSLENKKFTFIHRDLNAVKNILEISNTWLNNQERPNAFKRAKIDTLKEVIDMTSSKCLDQKGMQSII